MEQETGQEKLLEAQGLELRPNEINRQTGRIILPSEGAHTKGRTYAPPLHLAGAHGGASTVERRGEQHLGVAEKAQGSSVGGGGERSFSGGPNAWLSGVALGVGLLALCLAAVGWWRAGVAEGRAQTSELSVSSSAMSTQKWREDMAAMSAKVEVLQTKVGALEAEAQRAREALLEVKTRQTTLENLGVLVETPETKP
jgi:hypothetical protein